METTEDNNLFSREISGWSTGKIIEFIHTSDYRAFEAVGWALENIAEATEKIYERITEGGRVIYVGAGTSGRLAAQDVAELRPTYGIGSDIFDYVMAGGNDAILHSIEGAEDDREEAVRILKEEKHLKKNDIVFGISASGSTPFVISSLEYGKKLGALTVSLTNNRDKPVSKISDVSICCLTGAEIIQGSTRMKAGTCQKMVLGAISTTIAIKLGLTYKNTMSNMGAWYNEKLRKRAQNMLVREFGLEQSNAIQLLEENMYDMNRVMAMLERERKE